MKLKYNFIGVKLAVRKNKKERKKIKAIRLKNKKLVKRYPWLRAIDLWWNPIKGYDYTLLDDMSKGWRKCFGMMMVEDIDKALAGRELIPQQLKSKYGRMEFYCIAPQEVQDVIHAYSTLSGNICESCGQVDVGYTRVYVTPICSKCFCCDGYYTEKDYYEQISPHNRMALGYSYRKPNPETKRWEKYTVDISEYTNKVRVNWWKHHKE